MSGQRALIYSRVRKNALNPAESDITRGERNQAVLQALMSKLASFSTFMRLPFDGKKLMKPLATDLSANDFAGLGWAKVRAGRTYHCRLGGTSTGGDITPSEDNAKVILMVLGKSARAAARAVGRHAIRLAASAARPRRLSSSLPWAWPARTPRSRRPSRASCPSRGRSRSCRSPSP